MFIRRSRKLVAGSRREHLPDKLLYRDEAWFESLARERTVGEAKDSQLLVETMTAPPEEHGDAGPLVPCKVGRSKMSLFSIVGKVLLLSDLQPQLCSGSYSKACGGVRPNQHKNPHPV